jgi:hypothetical protein
VLVGDLGGAHGGGKSARHRHHFRVERTSSTGSVVGDGGCASRGKAESSRRGDVLVREDVWDLESGRCGVWLLGLTSVWLVGCVVGADCWWNMPGCTENHGDITRFQVTGTYRRSSVDVGKHAAVSECNGRDPF